MRRAEAVIRLLALAAIFVVTFSTYFETMAADEISLPWIWVTLAALVVSVVLVTRKLSVLSSVGTLWPADAGWGVPVVLAGLAIFVTGTFGGVTSSSEAWMHLVGSLITLVGLVWCAFGRVVARQLALPILPLAFLVEPFALSPVQTSWTAGAATAITLLIIVTQFRLSGRGRIMVLVSSVAAGLLVAGVGLTLVSLAAAPVVLVAAYFGEMLRGPESAICPVCGEKYSGGRTICLPCSREILMKNARPNRAPLVLSLSIVLLAGIAAVPVAYSAPMGLSNYTINGLTTVPFFAPPSGWNMTLQNSTSTNNILFSSVNLVSANNTSPHLVVNQTMTLARSGLLPPPSNSTAVLLAKGSLNDSEGITYSVISSSDSHSLILGWSTVMTARNSTGESQVFASLSVESTYQGRFNRTALAGDLAGSTALAETLVTRFSGFGTSSLYIYEGQIAFGFLGEYIATVVGASLIFGVAMIGTWSDAKTEERISGMKDLSADETAVLGSLSQKSNHVLADEAGLEGWAKSRVYDTINTLLARDLINLNLKVHTRFAGIKVSSAVGTI